MKNKSMVLFPEIFSNPTDKFNRLAVWLVNMEGVVCPNIRDVFTAGGQGSIEWNHKQYSEVPKIIVKMSHSINDIGEILNSTDQDVLEKYWDRTFKNRFSTWIEMIEENSKSIKLSINLKEYLKDRLAIPNKK